MKSSVIALVVGAIAIALACILVPYQQVSDSNTGDHIRDYIQMGYHPIWQKPELDPTKGRFASKSIEANLTTVAIEVIGILTIVGVVMIVDRRNPIAAPTPTKID
ncbi:MAG: hypothetical protein J0H83_13080 [Candidatus Melainabacteria bacterium]|nr:hypothetical protein [Candidatus Melainabacteria bacterium]MBX9674827.1 hypothetical protein [Candidatus Obscuribacterales bacterium]